MPTEAALRVPAWMPADRSCEPSLAGQASEDTDGARGDVGTAVAQRGRAARKASRPPPLRLEPVLLSYTPARSAEAMMASNSLPRSSGKPTPGAARISRTLAWAFSTVLGAPAALQAS